MNQRVSAVLRHQLLIDEIDVGNLQRFFLKIGVVLDIKSRSHHHLGNGSHLIEVSDGDAAGQLGPLVFHNALLCD